MAFANTINYAQIFNRILDEKFYILPRTMWMENTTPGIEWNMGREIQIPILDMDGLGNMQGYKAPDGDLTLRYETKILEYYRGRNFAIGRYDVDMTNLALTVSNALKVFLQQHVVPEVDKIRIARAAQAAVNYGGSCVVTQASSGIDADNILSLLLNDIAAVQDQIGEDEQLYIQISTTLKNVLQQSSQITRYLNVKDFQIKSATLRLEAINDEYLIGTPSSYMNSVIQLNDGVTSGQTVGGVAFGNLGPAVNWIIAARPAMDAVARPYVSKVIDPDINQDGEFWKIMFSIYHGVWTYDNKSAGLLVNMDTTLGDLDVSCTAGDSATLTNVAVTAPTNAATTLVYKVGSGEETVTAGTPLTGWATLGTGQGITCSTGQTVTVALVGANSMLPLAYGSAAVVVGS